MEPKKPNDPELIGDWSITGRLGEGEDCIIFHGVRGVAGSEQAAIKLIEDNSFEFESALKKIKNEVEALRQLNDENIVKLIEANYEPGNLWIATEYIHGVTLDTKLKQTGKPLEELYWFRVAANIFHGLQAAHAKGIIHKDIKPSNIIISESGAKLIDFGISHVPQNTRIANPGDFEGSRLFSAPENYNRKNIEEMDVFSAGVTLAYAAKLKSVWAGDNQDAITQSIKNDDPDLSGLRDLQEEFIRPLLQKLPIDRPNSESVHKKALEYIEYLVDKENKDKPTPLRVHKSLSRCLNRPLFKYGVPTFIVLVSFLLLLGQWQSNQTNLTTSTLSNVFNNFGKIFNNSSDQLTAQCQSSLRNANLDLSIETCSRAVAAGNLSANVFLARAHLAKGSPEEAKLILKECQSESLACKSDYAYFFLKGNRSLSILKSAYSEGDTQASWRIGDYYKKLGNISKALSWYEKSSKENNPIANIYLSLHWGEEKQYPKAINYAKLAINEDLLGQPSLLKVDRPVERLIDSLYTSSGDNAGKLSFFTKCADLNVTFCVSTVANAYLVNSDYVNARKWGLVGAGLQDGKSMWVLARVAAHKNTLLPEGTRLKTIDDEIVSWYKKAAKLGHVESAFSLAFSYGVGIGTVKQDWKESCSWFQKTMAAITERKGTYKEEDSDQKTYTEAAQFFELQTCQRILLGEAPALNFASPSPSLKKGLTSPEKPSPVASPSSKTPVPVTTVSKDPVPTPVDSNKPITSSDSFKVSAPLASDVQIDQIFGRAFKGIGLKWVIPLTNFKDDQVPKLTGIQFRLIGYPDAGWVEVPYKLKTDLKFGTVHAEVDDLLFAVVFKDLKYCPEFRVVREENGKITQIWDKGQPECANDYNP